MQKKEDKRKGYKDVKDQIEANKRYLKSNPEALKRKNYSIAKSTAKRFIQKLATSEDLEEFKEIILKKLNKF